MPKTAERTELDKTIERLNETIEKVKEIQTALGYDLYNPHWEPDIDFYSNVSDE